MDPQFLYTVVVPLALTGICFVVVLIILLKDYARVLPRNSVPVPALELKKLREDISRKDALVTKAEQEIQRLKSEADILKNEMVRLRDELAAKDVTPLLPREDSAEVKSLREESHRLKEELLRLEQELASLKAQSSPNTAVLEELLSAKGTVDSLRSELEQRSLELQSIKLRMAGDVKPAAETSGEGKPAAEPAADREELEKLKHELELKTNEYNAREQEIQKLTAEIQEGKASLAKAEGSAGHWEGEAKRIGAELETARASQMINAEQGPGLKEKEEDVSKVETALDEEKRSLQGLKLRIQEAKMKLHLLDEKSKEAVESIAKFAQGKEFDEFRRSVHLDEIVRKYEDEIKELKIKNTELEKKQVSGNG